MELTAAHWMYAFVTLAVIIIMLFKRGVVLPTLVGTLLVAWIYKGSFVGGLQAVFNANLVAANELFSIFLIITFMVALLNSLKDIGADEKMIVPIQKIMINGHISFLVILITTYVISLFFWPTPAIPLICTLLVPAAIRAGLPPMASAVIISIAGQGMALSSDYIMQVAPMLTATAAGIELEAVSNKVMILSLITGGVASTLAYLSFHQSIKKPNSEDTVKTLKSYNTHIFSTENEIVASVDNNIKDRKEVQKWGKVFAVLVPVSLLAVMIFMFWTKFGSNSGGLEGGEGAALIGGVAVVLLILASIAFKRMDALDKISEHITDGFLFAFRAMGPIIPIAGFFFLGSSDFIGAILSLSEEATKPAFLVDFIQAAQQQAIASGLPEIPLVSAFVLLIVGIITGLDGSGFSGLPLTGALSGAMASSGIDASTLGAIGQMGAIWTGGGTIVAWSSLVAIAGFCGVSVLALVRKNFIPVISGLIVSTIVAVIIW